MIIFNRRHYRVTPLNMQSFPDLSRVFLNRVNAAKLIKICAFFKSLARIYHTFLSFCRQLLPRFYEVPCTAHAFIYILEHHRFEFSVLIFTGMTFGQQLIFFTVIGVISTILTRFSVLDFLKHYVVYANIMFTFLIPIIIILVNKLRGRTVSESDTSS